MNVCGLQAKGLEQVCKRRVMLARLMLKRARIYAFYALCVLIDLRKKIVKKLAVLQSRPNMPIRVDATHT